MNHACAGQRYPELRAGCRRRTSDAWVLVVGLVALTAGALSVIGQDGTANQNEVAFRVGFSTALFADVNVDDARAAVKVWAQTIARERDIPTDPEPSILSGLAELAAALRGKQVDAVALTADEYGPLSQVVPLAPIFVTRHGGRFDEEYVLLVHRDSGITNLGDLHGRSLTAYENPRACLAAVWLDNLLAEQELPAGRDFLGRVSGNRKLARVVLAVFFRKSDACLVTRTGFDMMNELNPQTGKALKILATSPKVVPAVLCLRANYAPVFKDKLLAGLRDLHQTPSGQQVLTIFHGESLEEQPASCMDSALEMLALHRRLYASTIGETAQLLSSYPAGKETVD